MESVLLRVADDLRRLQPPRVTLQTLAAGPPTNWTRSRIYVTSDVRLSRRSTAAAACGGFAAERGRADIDRQLLVPRTGCRSIG